MVVHDKAEEGQARHTKEEDTFFHHRARRQEKKIPVSSCTKSWGLGRFCHSNEMGGEKREGSILYLFLVRPHAVVVVAVGAQQCEGGGKLADERGCLYGKQCTRVPLCTTVQRMQIFSTELPACVCVCVCVRAPASVCIDVRMHVSWVRVHEGVQQEAPSLQTSPLPRWLAREKCTSFFGHSRQSNDSAKLVKTKKPPKKA